MVILSLNFCTNNWHPLLRGMYYLKHMAGMHWRNKCMMRKPCNDLTTSCQIRAQEIIYHSWTVNTIVLYKIRSFQSLYTTDASRVTSCINKELVFKIWKLGVSKRLVIRPTKTWLITQEDFAAQLFWINNIPGLVPGPEPWHSDWEVSWFCQASSAKYSITTFKYYIYLYILPYSSFTISFPINVNSFCSRKSVIQ